jgi:hypothetical protein
MMRDKMGWNTIKREKGQSTIANENFEETTHTHVSKQKKSILKAICSILRMEEAKFENKK